MQKALDFTSVARSIVGGFLGSNTLNYFAWKNQTSSGKLWFAARNERRRHIAGCILIAIGVVALFKVLSVPVGQPFAWHGPWPWVMGISVISAFVVLKWRRPEAYQKLIETVNRAREILGSPDADKLGVDVHLMEQIGRGAVHRLVGKIKDAQTLGESEEEITQLNDDFNEAHAVFSELTDMKSKQYFANLHDVDLF